MRLPNMPTGLIASALLIGWPGNGEALGGFVEEFTDKAEWISAVGRFTTIGFTGFPDGTFITDQYADLGVLFVGGNENIFLNDFAFPNDGAGLDDGGFTPIAVSFDTPQAWIAVDFPGLIQFELFSGGNLIYTSSEFGIGGVGKFAGLVSTELFDLAVMSDRSGVDVVIDDLHFGVPAPSVLALLALGGLYSARRRG
ncbi:MAG: hypothetical protein IH830_00030 [Planctomycetes bacterium]|nr:hypothetical protein [Planctomycetota bacterium]